MVEKLCENRCETIQKMTSAGPSFLSANTFVETYTINVIVVFVFMNETGELIGVTKSVYA